jgi:hypothetical protein
VSPAANALEQLRYVARRWEMGDEFPTQEVASVLAELAADYPGSLLQACRRMIEYFPASGRMWWLSARVLSAADPTEGIWEAADELARDPTGRALAEALPVPGAVAVVAPSHSMAAALRRRKDLVLVKKARGADIVVISALAAGPGAALVGERASAIAATARRAGKALWMVAERGVILPEALWAQLLERALGPGAAPTAAVMAPGEVDVVVGEHGPAPAAEVLFAPTCPPVAELLGWRI